MFLIRRSIKENKKIYYLKNDERISIVTYSTTNGDLEIYNDIKLVEKYSWTENGVKGNYNNFETGQSEVW